MNNEPMNDIDWRHKEGLSAEYRGKAVWSRSSVVAAVWSWRHEEYCSPSAIISSLASEVLRQQKTIIYTMSTAPSRSAPPPPPPEEDSQGASASVSCQLSDWTVTTSTMLIHDWLIDERLLAAAKSDNEGMLEDALKELSDINQSDG